jgi:hypothetical protein
VSFTLFAGEEAYEATSLLEKRALEIGEKNTFTGWAYVVSGGVALAVSVPGYYLSEDIFARAVYSVGQALGVGTIGYGAYLILIENEYAYFQRILASSPDLTRSQKEKMTRTFLEENASRAKSVRRLRVITHSLLAGLNFLSGFTSSNRDLKLALCFVGGVNTIAALSFLIGSSEEEDLLKKLPQITIGPNPTLSYSFSF